MGSKSDELDYIANVMNEKKLETEKTVSKSQPKIILKSNQLNNQDSDYYKIGANKIHKNITIDTELVKWINVKAKEYNLNFSKTINQILLFSYEKSKNNKE